MPDDQEFRPADADAENNTPEAPPARPLPLEGREKMDWGCLAFLIAGFVGVFFVVPIVYFFSAFTIIPLLVLGLIGFLTIFVNPVEKRENKVKWTGRIITFVILTVLASIAAYFIYFGETPILRE